MEATTAAVTTTTGKSGTNTALLGRLDFVGTSHYYNIMQLYNKIFQQCIYGAIYKSPFSVLSNLGFNVKPFTSYIRSMPICIV